MILFKKVLSKSYEFINILNPIGSNQFF